MPESISAIVSIDKLSKHCTEILQNLNNGIYVTDFAQGQVAEERELTQLIINQQIDEDILLLYVA